MGACVFGGVSSEKIYLNDITLWSGEPVNPYMNPEAYKHVPEIRAALFEENYKLADSLNKYLQGSFSQSFAPLGTMHIDFKHEESAKSYYRELNISEAICRTKYEVQGIAYSREYFISHPDKVMLIKLSANEDKSLDCSINFESLLDFNLLKKENILIANGRAPVHAEPNYRGEMDDAVINDTLRGTRFTCAIQIKETDCTVSLKDNSIELSGGREAVIMISVATSFNGFDKNPATQGKDNEFLALKQLKDVSAKSYKEIKTAHQQDYQNLFNRVQLNLGETSAPNLPTNERLIRYRTGAEDKNLEILYFQYGRYLLISSSRTPGVPANLQGLWNPHLRPPWSSNYTMNINLEENYWLAENTNLSELHLPLLSFIENLSITGAITAKTFYGAGGWVACHNSDIWAMSNPVGDFGKGQPVWANWNMGGTWLSTHLWEHFQFSQDMKFLEEDGYPLMKGAAEFCLEWLIEDKHGFLITAPSTSPENKYISPEGYRGATLYGATADLSIIRELLEQTISASEKLETDIDFRIEMRNALEKLYPYQVGNKGNLQEWYYDWEDADPQHRHQSHLFGLYPGHQINPEKTPELAQACRTTLEIKGDETTGWSKGWRINLWARLWDGNRAYKMFRELLNYVEPDAIRPRSSNGGGTYPNLFDAHPPFQIDGNFGGAAALAEMLLQSTENEIRILPALPDAWDNGSVSGLCARGGYEVAINWENNSPIYIKISSKNGGNTNLIYGENITELSLKKGESQEFYW
jgi:alpha-L-fucosidase 2